MLGNIHFAFLATPVQTAVGDGKVYSSAYVSCHRSSRRLAVELTNTVAPSDPGGLKPAKAPRLICSRLASPTGEKMVQEDLLADWDVSDIGDAMARGLRAFPLRECVSINVVQEVALPPGWAQKTARIEFDIDPYSRALDTIFATCGEPSAYAPAAAVAVAAASASPPKAAPGPAESAWTKARVIPGGRTNVRARASLESKIVAHVEAGGGVLVQRTDAEWLRAKASSGAPFDGWIRRDRLVFP